MTEQESYKHPKLKERKCSRCENMARPGQGYCKDCHNKYMKGYRKGSGQRARFLRMLQGVQDDVGFSLGLHEDESISLTVATGYVRFRFQGGALTKVEVNPGRAPRSTQIDLPPH